MAAPRRNAGALSESTGQQRNAEWGLWMNSKTETAAETLAEMDENLSLGSRIGKVRWRICAMLFVATSINYMDRQVIGILKPTLEHSIGMSEIGYGYVVDAFQFAYALGTLLAGWFVDRVGTRIGYAVLMGIWSLSAMGHALANTVMQFGVARFFLGLGEAGNFPCALKTTAEWFPQSERSLATGIFNSGTNVGAILAPLIVPWVAIHYGWHAAFLITGIFSLAWIILWYRKYRSPGEHPTVSAAELHYIQRDAAPAQPKAPWARLLGKRQTWAYATAKFLIDPIWWFYLFWMPSYFSSRFHLNLSHLGLPLILVYNASAVGSIGGGWLPMPFRKMGMTVSRARLAAMLLCAIAVTPVFTINYTQSEWAAIGLLGLAAAAHQGFSSNLFSLPSDLFPKNAVGSVAGIGGMVGSLGGVLFATSTGYILQFTHSYSSLFAIAASVYLIAFGCVCLLAPGLRRVEAI
jgi:ACS family hexuronate transporter-like MFS transporter